MKHTYEIIQTLHDTITKMPKVWNVDEMFLLVFPYSF